MLLDSILQGPVRVTLLCVLIYNVPTTKKLKKLTTSRNVPLSMSTKQNSIGQREEGHWVVRYVQWEHQPKA